MEFAEAKNEIINLRAKLSEFESEYKELNKIYVEYRKKMELCESNKKKLIREIKKLEDIIESENIFESVKETEGFDTLLKEELVAISNGMNKTDYRKYANYPRWYDLERLVKEVIEFKKLYPGWILDYIEQKGAYDTLPPETYYKYTYKTPQGHYMSHGGIELLSS